MKTETIIIRSGNYGGEIRQRRDGSFEATLLYNMHNPTRGHMNGDLYDLIVYKSENMARRRIHRYIENQKQGA